ncbi:unnamed protein product [Penicillium salamii]|uniref:GED domain-containing protein n=1 Tax=Penicillium salamii TaxID=1612424 RepID=A0A9W4IV78_9EURO|nr:unnamed protein product [Penicillium salamii]CAG8143966.1 unnamed protein product [Penicillium salamii]CAG8235480.1 unnamed protein product [Penicillium salamii]CAG8278313.1 unnamed protein product [Penicillium salamii]CAG8297658.1 unnamed protein product [Penicillium salamii]
MPLLKTAIDEVQSEESELLDKIDELRAIGVGDLVEPPQYVICGSQSSGKSSVLEAISGVRVTAKSYLCTLFATEFILRQSTHNRINVSIEPGNSRVDEAERQKLLAFRSDGSELSTGRFSYGDVFWQVRDRARDCMGQMTISGYSDDVLKVEISGPQHPDLALVDLPGLHPPTTSGQPSSKGKEFIDSLTERYIKNPRNIILAVISAKNNRAENDYHEQNILDIAKRFDPSFERILGIVTHPDTLEDGSEEQETYLQIIKNEEIKLQLGWHVLKNRPFHELGSPRDSRDDFERSFFEYGRWASLRKSKVGIASLRRRLTTHSQHRIRRSIFHLMRDIRNRISDNEVEVERMGAPRETIQDQREYLSEISSGFTRITNQALNGSYVDEFFGGHGYKEGTAESDFHLRRLRAVMREIGESFEEAMSLRGARRIIQYEGAGIPFLDIQLENSKLYMEDWTPVYISQDDLTKELQNQARQSRGIELPGSANSLLVGSLFRDQCQPWEMIAKSHVLHAWELVDKFVELVLQHITNDHTRTLLTEYVFGPELDKMRDSLLKKLTELTFYYKTGHPLPTARSFLSKIQDLKNKRQLAILNGGITSNALSTFDSTSVSSQSQSSGDQFGLIDIIDQMQAYYESAISTFVDNIAILAIENCLLSTLEQVFTGRTVISMNDQQVRQVAAEPSYIQVERGRLNEELEKLRKARHTLNTSGAVQEVMRFFRSGKKLPFAMHRVTC